MNRKIIVIAALIMIALPMIAIAQPGPGNQLPYDIKPIKGSTQEVGNNLWSCYDVYDDDELLFYDCVIVDKKATTEQIQLVMEYQSKTIYDDKNKITTGNKIVDKNMDCKEYSKKLGDWLWVC